MTHDSLPKQPQYRPTKQRKPKKALVGQQTAPKVDALPPQKFPGRVRELLAAIQKPFFLQKRFFFFFFFVFCFFGEIVLATVGTYCVFRVAICHKGEVYTQNDPGKIGKDDPFVCMATIKSEYCIRCFILNQSATFPEQLRTYDYKPVSNPDSTVSKCKGVG
jgi:hypothetical protein